MRRRMRLSLASSAGSILVSVVIFVSLCLRLNTGMGCAILRDFVPVVESGLEFWNVCVHVTPGFRFNKGLVRSRALACLRLKMRSQQQYQSA